MRKIPPSCGKGHSLDEANTWIDKTGKWHCRTCARGRSVARFERRWQKRKQEQAARLASRPDWPPTDLAWVAGLFEGEGTATLVNSGRWGHVRSVVMVTSTDPAILEPFQHMWPGRMYHRHPRTPKESEAWTWSAEGETMMAFLLDVRPHLRRPRMAEKFDLILEVQSIRRQGSKDPDYKALLQGYRERMRVLNQRGHHAATP